MCSSDLEADRTSIPVTIRWRAQRLKALAPVNEIESPAQFAESTIEVPVRGVPGAGITLMVNGAVDETLVADEEGIATFELTLADGEYALTATQIHGAGYLSPASAAVSVLIDTTALTQEAQVDRIVALARAVVGR